MHKKLFLFLTSLIVSLVFLESSMRLIGFGLNKYREGEITKLYITRSKGNMEKIMFLGDSVTYGGNVKNKYNYPSQIAKLQEESGFKNKASYNFQNMGMCETNSYQMLEVLKEANEISDYDTLILLTGAADRYNFIGLNKENFVKKELRYLPDDLETDDFIANLRIYKMYRYIRNRLKLNVEICSFLPCFNRDNYHEMWLNESNSTSDWMAAYEAYHPFYDSVKLKDQVAAFEKFKKIQPYLTRGQVTELLDGKILNESNILSMDLLSLLIMIADPIAYTHIIEEDYESTIEILLDILDRYPKLFFLNDDDLNFFPYRFLHGFEFQNKYTSKMLISKLEEIKDTEVGKKLAFKSFYDYFKSRDLILSKINENLYSNLKEIATLSKDRKKRVIFLTYPTDVTYANTALRRVAKEEEIEMIDLNLHFEKFLNEDNTKDFIADYSHPTEKGYKVIAKIVWEYLTK